MKLSKKLILASNSPRRKEILTNVGFDFEIQVRPTDEKFDDHLKAYDVPIFLAKQKALCFKDYNEDFIILAADTVVICENEILNKPVNEKAAFEMLMKLSDKKHEVLTGVCLKIGENYLTFSDRSFVRFKSLSNYEIWHYLKNYNPYDKAGSYGVQDFIGMIGISEIIGSFYNVMGLPIHKIYDHLKPYLSYDK